MMYYEPPPDYSDSDSDSDANSGHSEGLGCHRLLVNNFINNSASIVANNGAPTGETNANITGNHKTRAEEAEKSREVPEMVVTNISKKYRPTSATWTRSDGNQMPRTPRGSFEHQETVSNPPTIPMPKPRRTLSYKTPASFNQESMKPLINEFRFYQKTQQNILGQKTELQKVIEKRQEKERKRQVEQEKSSQKTSLEKILEIQALKLSDTEVKDSSERIKGGRESLRPPFGTPLNNEGNFCKRGYLPTSSPRTNWAANGYVR